MHHPKEAVIDGVKFVLIPEELLNEVRIELNGLKWNGDCFIPRIVELCNKLEAL